MEPGGHGNRLDYEDMFKEITRKLYGEDLENRTSNVQNEFETSVSYKAEDEVVGHPGDTGEEGSWTLGDEPLKGTEGSRIAAYRATTASWRCYECGDHINSSPREVAEHFVSLHQSRISDEDSGRALQNITNYLEQVRDTATGAAVLPPARRTQETQTVPATILPVAQAIFLQELPPAYTHLPNINNQQSNVNNNNNNNNNNDNNDNNNSHNNNNNNSSSSSMQLESGSTCSVGSGSLVDEEVEGGDGGTGASVNGGPRRNGRRGGRRKSGRGAGQADYASMKYVCEVCGYGADRRDLFRRHEYIHKDEKPFHCYVCLKVFTRADHVKKHFLRIHKDITYNSSRIRVTPSSETNAGSPSPCSSNSSPRTSTASSPAIANGTANPYMNGDVYPKPPQQPQVQMSLPAPSYNHHQQQQQLQAPTPALAAAMYLNPAAVAAASAAAAVMQQHQQLQQQQQQHQQQQQLQQQSNDAVQMSAQTNPGKIRSSKGKKKMNKEDHRYHCTECSWSADAQWDLDRHIKTHTKPYRCTACEYRAARPERLAQHTLKVHNQNQCTRCFSITENFEQLQVHQQRCSANRNSRSAVPVNQDRQQMQQNQTNEPHLLPLAMHSVGDSATSTIIGGGRAPPGPPVFPASSAVMEPALEPPMMAPPPTTLSGPIRWKKMNRHTANGHPCWGNRRKSKMPHRSESSANVPSRVFEDKFGIWRDDSNSLPDDSDEPLERGSGGEEVSHGYAQWMDYRGYYSSGALDHRVTMTSQELKAEEKENEAVETYQPVPVHNTKVNSSHVIARQSLRLLS